MITSKMYSTRITPVDVQKPPGAIGPGPQAAILPICFTSLSPTVGDYTLYYVHSSPLHCAAA
ncbi:hypothetical protein J15TS10_37620 [Paenibacillus woosongensis]|uniref:Uncharacterized protein n=1 Tax=Paenibacillus woosongensis TaxID=307580 RepID=A0ABQ4MVI9_9BACL|nr:hypothetical protein J15TS10_37620 [Paenibacillus woosongensis]